MCVCISFFVCGLPQISKPPPLPYGRHKWMTVKGKKII